jgi:type VI secretion system protein ImpL
MEGGVATGTDRHRAKILLRQIGVRNAENTLYQNVLKQVSRNYADMTLADMTSDTQADALFSTEQIVPGMFTRQAWEGQVKEAIEQVVAARREEIDWVLSDRRKGASSEVSPETLRARLTERYFTDFAGSWLSSQQPSLEKGRHAVRCTRSTDTHG